MRLGQTNGVRTGADFSTTGSTMRPWAASVEMTIYGWVKERLRSGQQFDVRALVER